MNTEQNKAIICVVHAIVLNNAGGVARVLMQAGYEKKYLDACEMELTLLQVYLCDKQKFFSMMHTIDWNHGEKRTNAPEIKNELIAISNMPDTPENKGLWWKHILILLNR